MKTNIKAAIDTLKGAQGIDDLLTARNLLAREGVFNQNLENGIRAYTQGLKESMTMLILGPNPNGSGKSAVQELEQLLKLKGL